MTDIEKLITQKFAEEMTKKDNFLCEVIDNYNKLQEENEKLKKTIEKIKALNLFSLNNSREKIAEINAIINDQKESEER